MEIVLATPRRVYISASVAALVAGIGANALLLQMGRHRAASRFSDSRSLAGLREHGRSCGDRRAVAPHVSPTPNSEYSTTSAAAPLAGGISRDPSVGA